MKQTNSLGAQKTERGLEASEMWRNVSKLAADLIFLQPLDSWNQETS